MIHLRNCCLLQMTQYCFQMSVGENLGQRHRQRKKKVRGIYIFFKSCGMARRKLPSRSRLSTTCVSDAVIPRPRERLNWPERPVTPFIEVAGPTPSAHPRALSSRQWQTRKCREKDRSQERPTQTAALSATKPTTDSEKARTPPSTPSALPASGGTPRRLPALPILLPPHGSRLSEVFVRGDNSIPVQQSVSRALEKAISVPYHALPFVVALSQKGATDVQDKYVVFMVQKLPRLYTAVSPSRNP